MGLTQNLGRISTGLTADASLNIGVGVTPSGTYKFEVGTTSKFTGVATFGSTLSNGTYTYTLPSATGTLALTSDLSGYLPLTGGTLTGALGGTTGTFSGQFSIGTTAPAWGAFTNMLNLQSGSIGGTSTTDFRIFQNMYYDGSSYRTRVLGESQRWDMGGGALYIYSAASAAADAIVTPTLKFTLLNTGAATFSSSVTAGGELSTTSGLISISGGGGTPPTGGVGFRTVTGRLIVYGGTSDITFQKNSNAGANMTILEGGNVLIGTTTDAGYKLDVNGTVRTLDFSIKNSANAETIDLFLSPSTSNGFIDYPSSRSFTIRNKGSLGSLTLASTGAATFSDLAGTGSRAVLADANGLLSAPVSDISVKENIKTLDYGINDIMKLKPVSFEYIKSYKNFGEGKQIGNIAQDMAKVIPEAVFTTPSTGKMGINYDQLNGVYIKALQELQEQINTLKLEIQTLKNK